MSMYVFAPFSYFYKCLQIYTMNMDIVNFDIVYNFAAQRKKCFQVNIQISKTLAIR